jgi:signal peptidase I
MKKNRPRATWRRKSRIKTRHFGTSGFLRPWRCPAAKSTPLNFSAISTGMPHSLLRSIASMQEAREDPRLVLAAEMLRRRGTVHLKAWGTSMLPAVWPGDLLTIQGVGHDEAAPGDIVLVLRDGRFIVHRLVEVQRGENCCSWITRGDAMPGNDPPAPAFELLGRVAGICRGNRSFVPSRRISRLNFAMAWMLCRWGRVRSLALNIHAARLQAGASHL